MTEKAHSELSHSPSFCLMGFGSDSSQLFRELTACGADTDEGTESRCIWCLSCLQDQGSGGLQILPELKNLRAVGGSGPRLCSQLA